MRYIIIMHDGVEPAFVGPFDQEADAESAALQIQQSRQTLMVSIEELVAYDKDNLPLLSSDLRRMKLKLKEP